MLRELCVKMMAMYRQLWSIGLAGMVLALVAPAASMGEEVFPTETEISVSQALPQRISDLERAATTVDEWLAQMAQASVIQITGVRLTTTETDIQVILEVAKGQLPEPSTSVVGNVLILEFSGAVLVRNKFQQPNPAEGIALISVTNLANTGEGSSTENRVSVAITGIDAPPNVKVSSVAQGLALNIVPRTEASQDATEDEEIIVTGQQDKGYQATDATTATRTDTPLREIPQSIQVIPRQVLEDQRVIKLEDAVRNVSGVVPGNTFGNTQDGGFVIRGFPSFDLYLRNGFRDTAQGIREFANVERIEVLKGPASVLFGNLEPGGTGIGELWFGSSDDRFFWPLKCR
jgi:iron complex outermembrane recepter protein